MSNTISLEPPSKCACYVDVQCHYADVNVPSDNTFYDWVENAISYLSDNGLLENTEIELSIVVVEPVESQSLNLQYRQQDKPTNILSFPFETPDIFKQHQEVSILGDLIICAAIVESEALQQQKETADHWAHMLVHGILHLLGYDHINDADAKVMEDLEIKILSQQGINNLYLEIANE